MRQDIEHRIAAFFASSPPAVAAVYLFGSTARNDARSDSDVDVAVLFNETPGATLNGPRFSIEGELERALGRRVDVVTLNDAPVDLRIRVLREGCLLVDCRSSTRIAFEVRTRNEAFDLEPILTRYRGRSQDRAMTDAALIAKKLALIETCVSELQRLARPDALSTDIREQRFVEHTLQIAIQAALGAASHIGSELRLGEPRSSRELFDSLEKDGWIPGALAATLRTMVGLRNVLVHGYDDVDLDVVRNVLEAHLDDLLDFARLIRGRLPSASG